MYIFIFVLDDLWRVGSKNCGEAGRNRRGVEKQRKECMKLESAKDHSLCADYWWIFDEKASSIKLLFSRTHLSRMQSEGPSNVRLNTIICPISSHMPDVRLTARHINSRQPETFILTSTLQKRRSNTRSTSQPCPEEESRTLYIRASISRG